MQTDHLVRCPRCEINFYTPYGSRRSDFEATMEHPYPALSRLDNETYICSPCGTDEAMRDFAGEPPIPPSEWPVDDA